MGINKIVKSGLTFDDVLLIPAKSKIHPRDVKLETKVTRKIRINVPLVSAAMDTVTESELAIAIAREGGKQISWRRRKLENPYGYKTRYWNQIDPFG